MKLTQLPTELCIPIYQFLNTSNIKLLEQTSRTLNTSVLEYLSYNLCEIIDIAFVVDKTGSMGPYINQVQEFLKNIFLYFSENIKLRIAFITYEDYCSKEKAILVADFVNVSEVHDKLLSFVNKLTPNGGSDDPECLERALYAASKLSWLNQSRKLVFIITDALPHCTGLSADNYPHPHNSPYSEGNDFIRESHKLASKDITVYPICCTQDPSVQSTLGIISGITKGITLELNHKTNISDYVKYIINAEIELNRVTYEAAKLYCNEKLSQRITNIRKYIESRISTFEGDIPSIEITKEELFECTSVNDTRKKNMLPDPSVGHFDHHRCNPYGDGWEEVYDPDEIRHAKIVLNGGTMTSISEDAEENPTEEYRIIKAEPPSSGLTRTPSGRSYDAPPTRDVILKRVITSEETVERTPTLTPTEFINSVGITRSATTNITRRLTDSDNQILRRCASLGH